FWDPVGPMAGGGTTTSNVWIYNNVFQMANWLSVSQMQAGQNENAVVVGSQYSGTWTWSGIVIANNTIVDLLNEGVSVIGLGGSSETWTNCLVANNLIYDCGLPGRYEISFSDASTNGIRFAYNYLGAGAYGGHTNSPAQLPPPAGCTSLGGSTTPVQFLSYSLLSTNSDLHLATNDTTCAGQGMNLSTYFGTAADGTARPASGAWDIGAYQRSGSSVVVASFSALPTSGPAPLTVTFTDGSTGAITNRSWQFGDGGSTNTTATTVVHQYGALGTDTVQLLVTGPGGSSISSQANLIVVSSAVSTNDDPPPVALFTATPTNGTVPLTVTFTDSSTGTITSRSWQFGDGGATITTATTVVHQYGTPGTDTVQLLVTGPGGSSISTQANLIVVSSTVSTNSDPAPVAAFDATPTNGIAPLTVTFSDNSTGTITNRLWSFGDGTITNTAAAGMVHVYTTARTNSVHLVVYGPGGTSSKVRANYIAVASSDSTNSVPPPVASFTAAPTSGTVPLIVTFADTSTGTITSRSWQFGDGSVTNTTATTVVYQYNTPGDDTVQLIVNGPGGSSTNVQPNLIAVASVPPPAAAFTATPTSGTVPLLVTFTDTSTGTITNRLWNFGDGSSVSVSGSTVLHQYTGSGTDTVQLAVSGPGGTSVDVQSNLIIVNPESQSGTNGPPQVNGHDQWRFLEAR
ncbi:MAG TPA: PKD domain-containing protein, partial [Verrucomicrobiae bacterium]|nr:PKD domain-containing protein [Verrucomicrobiae bacterium]